jgi:hypothetical protein
MPAYLTFDRSRLFLPRGAPEEILDTALLGGVLFCILLTDGIIAVSCTCVNLQDNREEVMAAHLPQDCLEICPQCKDEKGCYRFFMSNKVMCCTCYHVFAPAVEAPSNPQLMRPAD